MPEDKRERGCQETTPAREPDVACALDEEREEHMNRMRALAADQVERALRYMRDRKVATLTEADAAGVALKSVLIETMADLRSFLKGRSAHKEDSKKAAAPSLPSMGAKDIIVTPMKARHADVFKLDFTYPGTSAKAGAVSVKDDEEDPRKKPLYLGKKKKKPEFYDIDDPAKKPLSKKCAK